MAPQDDEKRKGLNDLRNSFLFLAIGAALSLVPVVTILGSLLSFIGLIFLIMGWRALGRSSLPAAPRYKSTGNWIIYSIIIAVVIAMIGFIAIVIVLISSLASSGFPTGPGSSSSLFQSPAIQDYIADLYAVILVAEIPMFYAWYRVSSSLRALGAELGQPKLRTAGRLFLVYIALWCASLVASFAAFKAGVISFSPTVAQGLGALGDQYTEFVGTYAVVIILGTIVGAALMILGSYLAYGGIKGTSIQ